MIIRLHYLLLVLLLVSCQTPPEERPPNVLLIISDDQAWSDYGFMGHAQIQTPHLDHLASNSLCFTRGYATAPLCSPSLASIISGRYAYTHGVTGNDPAFDYEGKRYAEEWMIERTAEFQPVKENFYQRKILTQYLSDAGYRSLQTGKWWLGSWQEGHFDAGMTHGNPAKRGRHGDEGLLIGREGLDTIFSFIEQTQAQDQPFFVWYAPFLPHTPHNPPDRLLAKYRELTDSEFMAKYWAMCEWFDETCGELMTYLEENSLAAETLVIYTTDNGWIQNPERNGYAPRSKRTPYEKGIRTPFMLHWPGKITPNVDKTSLVSNIDIVPTILAAAQITPQEKYSGINLLQPAVLKERQTIFAETFAHDMPDIQDPSSGLQYRVAIDGFWKLILPDTTNLPEESIELFDLKNDPEESTNLAERHPEVVARMIQQTDNWWSPRLN